MPNQTRKQLLERIWNQKAGRNFFRIPSLIYRDPNEDEYLPFTFPPGSRSSADGSSIKYVSFKCLVVDGKHSKVVYSLEGDSNGGAGVAGAQVYSTRKIRKKPAYHDDYTFSTDARKLKVKPKQVPKKTSKPSSKPAKPSGNQVYI